MFITSLFIIVSNWGKTNVHLPENTQIVVYSHNEIPYNNQSEWIAAIGKNVDESLSMLSEESYV